MQKDGLMDRLLQAIEKQTISRVLFSKRYQRMRPAPAIWSGNHLSRPYIAVRLKRPTRNHCGPQRRLTSFIPY